MSTNNIAGINVTDINAEICYSCRDIESGYYQFSVCMGTEVKFETLVGGVADIS
jgi:hypothetical protein